MDSKVKSNVSAVSGPVAVAAGGSDQLLAEMLLLYPCLYAKLL